MDSSKKLTCDQVDLAERRYVRSVDEKEKIEKKIRIWRKNCFQRDDGLKRSRYISSIRFRFARFRSSVNSARFQ